MGTRNLTMVVSNGQTKVAQYGQWDGYPSGQGATILNFLKGCDMQHFKSCIDKLSWLTEEQDKEIEAVGDKWTRVYPYISRDIGGEILEYIYKNDVLGLMDKSDFAAHSLHCEWAYVVDLDKNTFEVYEGFNKQPLAETERFYGLSPESDNGYYPVNLAKSYSLSELPNEDDFVKTFKAKKMMKIKTAFHKQQSRP